MKNFLPLLVCLSLSLFTVARATMPTHKLAPGTTAFLNANAVEEVASDDDDSTDEGEEINDDNSDDAPGAEDTGDDEEGDDDGGADGSGDEGR